LLQFEDELGADPGYEPIGCLLLAGPDAADGLRHRQALLSELGIETDLLGPAGISRLTPGLNLNGIAAGLYDPRAGCIDPHSIMMAYARHARRLGADLVEDVEATGLEVQAGRVVGISTSAGKISTSVVVNAAGFRARQVAHWAGLNLPITNIKRHIVVTGPVAPYTGAMPFTYEVDPAWYMRREGPGLLVGMGTVESDEEDPKVDWAFVDTLIDYSMHRAPPLARAGVRDCWAGLRPVTPDEDPVLGPATTLRGFFNDCGWGGHGIMHGPAGGLVLAEWIVNGEVTSVETEPFLAERFGPGVLLASA
jgi:sarcosine oxidase subunit beta